LRELLPVVVTEEATMWGIPSMFVALLLLMILGSIVLVVLLLMFA
jgi:hypothetical protein